MKQLLASLMIVLLLLTACGHNPPSARGATPEEAAMNVIPKLSNPAPTKIDLHGTHVTPYGTAVFYTTEFAAYPESAGFGFVLAEKQGSGWITRDIQQTNPVVYRQTHKYVFVTGTVHDLNGRVGSTWGRVLKPEVAAVEVMFNDGQIMRDTITPEGMFIVMANNTFGYCTVRVLDGQGQVLETIRTEAANGCDPGVGAPSSSGATP